MAQQAAEPARQGILRRIFGRHNVNDHSIPEPIGNGPKAALGAEEQQEPDEMTPPSHGVSPRPGPSARRASYNVIPGLPRAQTFKRQQSEQRTHLEPVEQTPDERRALSVDRRSTGRQHSPISRVLGDNPRTSAPGILGPAPGPPVDPNMFAHRLDSRPPRTEESQHRPETLSHMLNEQNAAFHDTDRHNVPSMTGTHSVADSGYEDDDILTRELDTKWILNLSMHFRDRSKREKFFVTYRQEPHTWRRVTISLDYRDAPPDSLESQLDRTRYQRDKIAKIYEAIRESLEDIQFYDTVTNLKLQTLDGRLYVHVMEDGNEIIRYPPVREVRHLNCMQVRERDIVFDSHMSGFVYKVRVGDKMLIKKEIPSPETVDEFLYEINALNALQTSENVIDFYGVVVDDHSQLVKGLLIDYADRGTLIDLLYEHRENRIPLPWATREKWARQIVQGLADVHESGFVQGDFTLSNIVITKDDDAKIIDINRRGCPVGWEPPEAAPLIESGHRIAMYIGVKSDLYQLGMVLWAIAVLEDEPEMRGRPLFLGPEDNVPDWYRQVTEICLSPDPRSRSQAVVLLHTFPPLQVRSNSASQPRKLQFESTLRPSGGARSPSEERRSGLVAQPSSEWSHVSRTFTGSATRDYGSSYYPPRGRSPPSRQPSTPGDCTSPSRRSHRTAAWCDGVESSVPRSHYSTESIRLDTDEMPQHNMSVEAPDEEGRLIMGESAQTLKAGAATTSAIGPYDGQEGDLHIALHEALSAEDGPSPPKLTVQEPSPIEQHAEEKTPTGTCETGHDTAQTRRVEDEVPTEFSKIETGDHNLEPRQQNEAVPIPLQPAPAEVGGSSSLETITTQVPVPQELELDDKVLSSEMAPLSEPKQSVDHVPEESLPAKGVSANTEQTLEHPLEEKNPTIGSPMGLPQSQASEVPQGLTHGQTAVHTGLANATTSAANACLGDTLHSSSAPVSRSATDEFVPAVLRTKPNSDGKATTAAAQAPRSCDPGPPATMSLTDMSSCLAGIGDGLGNAMMEKNQFDDDFSILGQPPPLMISTDANT